MTDDFREDGILDADFYEAVVRYLDGQLTPTELPAFEARLTADSDARQILLDVCLQMAAIAESPKECLFGREVAGDPWPPAAVEKSDVSDPRTEEAASLLLSDSHVPLPSIAGSLPTIVVDDSSVFPASNSSFSLFFYSNLFSLLILGVGILGAWLYQVDIPRQTAQESRPSGFSDKRLSVRRMEYVGQITGILHVKWSEASTAAFDGARVPLGRKYALASGLMEITYDSGAKVILQGPATYEVDSHDGGFLSVGRLTARLEKKPRKVVSGQPSVGSGQWAVASKERSEVRGQGSEQVASETNPKSQNPEIPKSTISNPQSPIPNPSSPTPAFAVRTPTATVTDLGTEFSVKVEKHGKTITHVFRGTVQMRLGSGGNLPDKESIVVLHENESAQTAAVDPKKDNGEIVLRRVSFPEAQAAFVRTMPCVAPKRNLFDLLTVVAGGYSDSRRRERGIDPTTGQEVTEFYRWGHPDNGKYHIVEWHKLIDGVFSPNGKTKPVVLDSDGHTFSGFPERVSDLVFCPIWARAVTVPKDDMQPHRWRWPYVMNDADRFMPNRRGLLCIHSTAGITFNLNAIRELNSNMQLHRFCAVAGLANHRIAEPDTEPGQADLWIFIDGKLKFQRMRLHPEDGVVSIILELDKNDRFLTLATTDGGDGFGGDWVVFGDPVLEMFPIKND